MEFRALRGGIPSKPRKIRGVVRMYKNKADEGRVKMARDYNLALTVEQVKAQYPRTCEGVCIWGGTVEPGTYFARLDSGIRQRMGKATVPITREYHFSCLPRAATPLRRFFEPLPWKATLVRGPDSKSTRLFASVEEWQAWMALHFPDMAKRFVYDNVNAPGSQGRVIQHGTDYSWCALRER